jgi:hypothetical protein
MSAPGRQASRGRGRGGNTRTGGPPRQPGNGAAGPQFPKIPKKSPAALKSTPNQSIKNLAKQWANQFIYRVSPQNATFIAQELNIPTQICSSGAKGVNPHEVSAKAREQACVWAIAELVADGAIDIDFRYGSYRDTHLITSLNNFLASKGHPQNYISHTVCDPWYIPPDVIKRNGVDVPRARYAIYVDIYAAGGTPGNPLPMTPSVPFQQGYYKSIWIGHSFPGLYGKVGPSVWIRSGDQITWKPDEFAAAYAPHHDAHLMCTSGAIGPLSWFTDRQWVGSTVDTNGNRTCYFIASQITVDPAKPIPPQFNFTPHAVSGVFHTSVPAYERYVPSGLGIVTSLFRSCVRAAALLVPHSWFPTESVALTLHHYTSTVAFLEPKSKTGWSLRSCQSYVNDLLSKDVAFTAAEKAFPLHFSRYRLNLSMAAFQADAAHRDLVLSSTRQSFATHFSSIDSSVTNISTPPPPETNWSWWTLGAAAVLSIASVLKKRFFSTISAPATDVAAWPNDFDPNSTIPILSGIRLFLSDALNFVPNLFRVACNCVLAPVPLLATIIDTFIPIYCITVVSPWWEESFKHAKSSTPWRLFSSSLISFIETYDPYSFIFHTAVHYYWSTLPFETARKWHSYTNVAGLIFQFVVASVFSPQRSSTGTSLEPVKRLAFVASITTAFLFAYQINSALQPISHSIDFDLHTYGSLRQPLPLDQQMIQVEKLQNIIIPSQDVFSVPVVPIDPTIRVSPDPSITLLRSPAPSPGFFRLYGVNCRMTRLQKSGINMQAMITRLTKQVPFIADDSLWLASFVSFCAGNVLFSPTLHRHTADEYAIWFSSITPPPQPDPALIIWALNTLCMPPVSVAFELFDEDDDESFDDWMAHVDQSKKKAYLRARHEISLNPLTPSSPNVLSIKTNMKLDEVLLKINPVPRAVHAVDPKLAVTLGPYVYKATTICKTLLNFPRTGIYHEFLEPNGVLSFTIGAGKTVYELSHWWDSAISTQGVHVIVAGDDSVIIRNLNGVLALIEGDNSQHDHTVRLPALAAEWKILSTLGVPKSILELMVINSSATLVCEINGCTPIKIHRGYERNTGGVDTTLGNSLNIILAAAGTIFRHKLWTAPIPQLQQLVQLGMSEYGFETKCRVTYGLSTDLGQGTFQPPSFLKGTWYKAIDKDGSTFWCWGPLLSRFIKLSKVMSDPRITMKFPNEGPISLEIASQRQIVAMAKGALPFALPPVLRSWLESFLVYDPSDLITPHRERDEMHKPTADDKQQYYAPTLDTSSFILQSAIWYDLDPQIVDDFLNHLSTIRLHDFSLHPMWQHMAMRDYN